LYVEVVDTIGRQCPAGVVGEITVTGGRNPFLPLLRFRTGDWAAMSFDDGVPCLTSFEGRSPVGFLGTDSRRINNIDVATVLRPFPLALFSLHQSADRSLTLRLRGAEGLHATISEALTALFGPGQRLTIEPLPEGTFKVAPYSTDIA
jgi:phenylacetate-CoA ligase